MNILKSLFISGFMMLSMAIIAVAAWMMLNGGRVLAWFGVILTTAPFMMLIGRLMISQNVARTSSRLPVVNVLGVIGLGLAIVSWLLQNAGVLAPTLAMIGWTGFLLYTYWYSSLSRSGNTKLKVGGILPDFVVKDISGDPVSSTQLTDRPAVLIFYRGNWCPLCMAQIKELASLYRDLDSLGVRIALISPQPHSNTVELAKKFDVNFDFLTDEGNSAARILGIESKNGIPTGLQMLGYDSETVLPTVIITGHSGKVIWMHETDNYRVRPEPDIYLQVLREHGVIKSA